MSSEAGAHPSMAKAKPRGRQGPHLNGGSRDGRQTAAVVLETLAGARTPLEAAEALGVSAPRYYMIELKALRGLLAACEPRPRGTQVDPGAEADRLRKEVARLDKDLKRQQALTRATQRAIGLVAPAKPEKKEGKGGSRRRRRPTVRGLRAAQHLKALDAERSSQEG